MTIDSHCHLGQEDYDIPVHEVIQNAQKSGVQHILAVACDPKDWDELLVLLQREPTLYGAIGVHPEYAQSDMQNVLRKLFQSFQTNRLVALGEIGLDYHEAPETKELQKALFFEQIKMAHTLNKPIMIHTRDAEDDTISVLSQAAQMGLLNNGGVIHCFTGSLKLAQFALDLGFYISASGVITFKNAQELRQIFAQIPLNRLLVETDAPWLAPTPYRGQKNCPAFVQETLKKLADIHHVSQTEMEKTTTENFHRLYLGGEK